MFNEDLITDKVPEPVERMKNAISNSDAVLFMMPEFNRSVPAVLKNAIDWGSRPWGDNSWSYKPGAIGGVTKGTLGTAVGQAHLRTSLIVLDVILMGQPELYVNYTDGLVDRNGNITNPATEAKLRTFLQRFASWIERVS